MYSYGVGTLSLASMLPLCYGKVDATSNNELIIILHALRHGNPCISSSDQAMSVCPRLYMTTDGGLSPANFVTRVLCLPV